MSEEEKQEERRDRFAFATWAVVTVIIILICIGYPWALLKVHELEPSDVGVFGDQYGALNALFSGIAFAALVATVFLQRNELRATRREMREQNKTAKISAQALSLSNRVQVLASLLNADLELVNYHKRMLEEAQRRIDGIVEERNRRMDADPTATNDAARRRREESIRSDTQAELDEAHQEHRTQRETVAQIYRQIAENRSRLAHVAGSLEPESRQR